MARTFTKNLANDLTLGVNALNPLLSGAGTILAVAQIRPSSYDTGTLDNKILAAVINGNAAEGASLNMIPAFGEARARGAGRSQSSDTIQVDVADSIITANADWHTVAIALRFGADQIQMYLDGAADAPVFSAIFGATTYTPGTPTGPDRIGSANNGQANQQFAGAIEYISLFVNPNEGEVISSLASGTHPFDLNPAFLMVLGYQTPDVDLMGSGIQSTINGSLPFFDGPTGLPNQNHNRLLIGSLGVASTDGDVITQDPDYQSSVNQAVTTGGSAGSDRLIFVGNRTITAIETNNYTPTINGDRFWVAGLASYKEDTTIGGTTPAPEITSVLTAETTEGVDFFYEIIASGNPFEYSAVPTPAGLVVDQFLGHITGSTGPGTAGTYEVILGATNDSGTGQATLILTVHAAEPAPPGGVFKHKPLPTAIVTALGNVYAASTKF